MTPVASINRCTPFRISQAVTSLQSSFNRFREPCAILDFNAMIVSSMSFQNKEHNNTKKIQTTRVGRVAAYWHGSGYEARLGGVVVRIGIGHQLVDHDMALAACPHLVHEACLSAVVARCW